jgi:hypothetical protein
VSRWWAVVEARHDLQNPTSAEKIRLLGERLGLDAGSRVLDVASGRAGPALVLARELGCRVESVERSTEFAAAARERIEAAGLGGRIGVVEADAAGIAYEPAGYDAALCLGATFVWGGVAGTLAALVPAVRPGGFVALGEPYWRTWPLPPGCELEWGDEFATLPETVERIEACGVEVVTIVASAEDDWDRYESLHWLALDEWLRANPHDPDADELRSVGRESRDRYLRWQRDLLGWAIFAART